MLPRTFSNTYQTCDLSDPDAPCTIKGNNCQRPPPPPPSPPLPR